MSLSELARSRAAEPNRTRSRRSGITSGRSARRCRMSSAVAATVMWSLYRSGVRGVKGTILLMMSAGAQGEGRGARARSEEHTSELQSPYDLVCRLLLEKKKKIHVIK